MLLIGCYFAHIESVLRLLSLYNRNTKSFKRNNVIYIYFCTLVIWAALSEPWGFGMYKVILYRFSLCETNYILLINGFKSLS